MEEMATNEATETADKVGKVGKRDAAEEDGFLDKEHVGKKQKISVDESGLVAADLTQKEGAVPSESDNADKVTSGLPQVNRNNIENDHSAEQTVNLEQSCSSLKFVRPSTLSDEGEQKTREGLRHLNDSTICEGDASSESNCNKAVPENEDVVMDDVDETVTRNGTAKKDANVNTFEHDDEVAVAEKIQHNCRNQKLVDVPADGVGPNRHGDTQNETKSAEESKARSKEAVSEDLDDACKGSLVSEGNKNNEGVSNPDGAPIDGVTNFPNSEKNVGITEFVNPIGSINGIIKQRYSDFIVNELNLAGQVVKLTTKAVPREAACECPDVSSLLGDDVQQRLDDLQKDKNFEKVFIPVDTLTKEERRKIHQFVRAKHSRLLSTTEDEGSQKFIVVTHGSKDQSRQGKNRKQTSWPPDRGNYTQFVLHKENIDTMDAINIISKYIKMNPASFTYSGTKDKRAITSQLVTVYRVIAEKLAGLNTVLRNITLGNFEYVKSPLRLGDLSGNRFMIVVRKICAHPDSISLSMKSLADKGFINYFGMQRFGTTAIPTYHIGRALLRGNWKEAIELILKPRDADEANLAECRKLWWETRDASAALSKLRRKNSVEGQLLYGLESHGPNDLVNAINCVPRNTRLMYTHSYQSYVWNRVVSRRLQKYQFSTIDGDLVDLNGSAEVVGECPEKLVPRVYKVSESETVPDITAVVLPLPGYDVVYPENEIATWYREIMSEDGLDIDNMKHKVQSYSLSGNYRRMLVKPIDVSWKVVKYDDVSVPLLKSDLDVLSGKEVAVELENGSFTALKMEFSLPPSSYATMALREVMKVDTSVAFQSTLK